MVTTEPTFTGQKVQNLSYTLHSTYLYRYIARVVVHRSEELRVLEAVAIVQVVRLEFRNAETLTIEPTFTELL